MQQVNLDRMYEAPSSASLLGTDQLGRDLLWRIMEGGRISLWIGLIATLLATIIGCSYGLVSAMSRDWVDRILMQALDAALAIPVLLVVIVFQAFGDSSLLKIILTIGFASWMATARMMRTECRRLLQSTYIQAAIAAGTPPLGIALKHLLPNAFGPLIVVVTVGVGQAILLETTLSFLNLGVPATVSFDLQKKTARLRVEVKAKKPPFVDPDVIFGLGIGQLPRDGVILILKNGKIIPIPIPDPEFISPDLRAIIRGHVLDILKQDLVTQITAFQNDLTNDRLT